MPKRLGRVSPGRASSVVATAPSDVGAIPITEFADRRRAVLKALGTCVGIVFAGDHEPHLEIAYRPHAHFEYLTGIVDEPGAILLLDPNHPVAGRRAILLLRPLLPEVDRWDGHRDELSSALRQRTGFETVLRTVALPRFLLEAARRSHRLAMLHPPSVHTTAVSPDLEVLRRVAERLPGTVIEDRSTLLASMRAVKNKVEIAAIRRAVAITTAGFDATIRSIRPGQRESDVQETLEAAYRAQGARQLAFRTIAGGGLNSTILHYHANNQPLHAGDLICIDSGARFAGYAADITRTVPVSGRFTQRQRNVYEVVLAAQRAAIKRVKPGATLLDVDAAARKVIDESGFADAFVHGIGHHLGLETHDISPDEPLKSGAVITIEPGIYLSQERIGIRIEDDILVTPKGAEVLSKALPTSVKEIEAMMGA